MLTGFKYTTFEFSISNLFHMRLAVVGASGMVGQVALKILEERNFPVDELIPVASEKSIGKQILFKGQNHSLVGMKKCLEMKPDLAIFSAGGSTSIEFAPEFAKIGCRVIDNSSAWRMSPDHKLIVPEINGELLDETDYIIANPNCSTIQLVMALAPIHKAYTAKRVVISTYQSISGTGKAAVEQMEAERNNTRVKMAYPYPIDLNCIPHCDVFESDGYTKEEIKLTNETKKILDPKIAVTATSVRIPVVGGHSEAVNVEFDDEYDLDVLRSIWRDAPGITVQDNPDVNVYPMPLYCNGKDDVFVGRIRRDLTQPKTLNFWVVSDNLRKGAATNAIQIGEILLKKNLI